ncbi:MAG: class I SAM-dependent methyltransferase [Candidatus Taylorbacteria bacterium]|nr:class I SAM-dependent methyltransferase [Candidatus Taylorbacteria bacterium]
MKTGRHISKCQICNADLHQFLSLGHHAVTQQYLTDKSLNQEETLYPMNLCRCHKCGLIQLDYIVDPKIVFAENYPYRTGLTNMLIRNFENLAESATKAFELPKSGLIIDIGSNDGSLLKPFRKRGFEVLGVEPTDAAKDANHDGIKTIQAFFNKNMARKILKTSGKATLITCTNTFAHIDHSHELVTAIKLLMDDRTVFVSESQYLFDIIAKTEFDTVYHEHLRFYSLLPLAKLFEMNGMTLVDAEKIGAAGGSIRVYAMKGNKEKSRRLIDLIAAEKSAGLYEKATYENYANKVLGAKFDLVALLLTLKKKGAEIAGLTSSARSNSLLSTCKIDNHILSYLGEKNGSPKIGLYTPGTHIPVVSEDEIIKKQPPYLLVLSWHIGDELISIMKKAGYKGKFIIPLPVAKIVE